MILLGLFSSFLIGSVLSDAVFLEPGKIQEFSTPNYPFVGEHGEFQFHFKVKNGYKIIAYCNDYRVIDMAHSGESCAYFNLTFSDGIKKKEFCNDQQFVGFETSTSELFVVIKNQLSNLVNCFARTTEEPIANEVILNDEKSAYNIEEMGTSYADKLWLLKSFGNKIKLYCVIHLMGGAECTQPLVIIETGKEIQKHCSVKEVNIETSDPIKIRLMLPKEAHAYLRCNANINDKPKPVDPIKVEYVEETKNVNIEAGMVYKFESDTTTPTIKNWRFNSPPGTKIRIHCPDFGYVNYGEKMCDHYQVTFTDGKFKDTNCADLKVHNYQSETNDVIFSIKSDTTLIIGCNVRSDEDPVPNIIELALEDGIHEFSLSDQNLTYTDHLWVIKSVDNNKLSLQCQYSNSEENCWESILRVNTGSEEKNYCSSKLENLVVLSSGNTIKVRAQIGRRPLVLYCSTQVITGPNPNQLLNLESGEIDSSEHGGVQGEIANTCDCGRRNHEINRIFFGKNADEGEFTWMASIRSPPNEHRCGGSVITPYHILTAAHCMVNLATRDRNNLLPTLVAVAAHHRSEPSKHGFTKVYSVKQTFIQDEYFNFEKHYDIAVLVMNEKIEYNQYVGPICLTPVFPKIIYKEIKLTGWGLSKIDSTHYLPEYLQTTSLFVVPQKQCTEDDFLFCVTKKNTFACFGDSGGPYVIVDKDTNRYVQLGVVSYGQADCLGQSGVTNVPFFFNWIREKVKSSMPGQDICYKVTENI